jgi:hypothetical protein
LRRAATTGRATLATGAGVLGGVRSDNRRRRGHLLGRA